MNRFDRIAGLLLAFAIGGAIAAVVVYGLFDDAIERAICERCT